MVTVTGFRTVETEEGDKYIRLVLSGDLEMVQSQTTGNYYATTRRATISSTFDETQAELMIGKQLDGHISQIEVDEYEMELEDGKKIKVSHRWVFAPEGQNASIVDIKLNNSKAKAA